jgi:S1-C subfamily serine protease
MGFAKLVKKYLQQLLVTGVIITSSTTGVFLYTTLKSNSEILSLKELNAEKNSENNALNSLVVQITSLNDELNENLIKTNKEISDLVILKSDLESEILGLESDVEELETELREVNTQIAVLESRVSSLNAQIVANSAALSSLSSQNGLLSSQISSLNSEISSLNSEIAGLNIQLNNFIIENSSKIDFSIVNEIAQTALKANVRVIVPLSSTTASVGSGVVYKYTAAGNKYYVMTNDHVIKNHVSAHGSIKVENYRGDPYNAVLLITNPLSDIAILEVSGTSNINFSLLNFESQDYILNNETNVISIGGPRLQYNTITLGKVSDNDSTVSVSGDKTYNGVISHTAVINQGSSGGALINFSLKIVGINFAGTFSGDPSAQQYPYQNVNGYAIDLAKIYELLGSGQPYSLP